MACTHILNIFQLLQVKHTFSPKSLNVSFSLLNAHSTRNPKCFSYNSCLLETIRLCSHHLRGIKVLTLALFLKKVPSYCLLPRLQSLSINPSLALHKYQTNNLKLNRLALLCSFSETHQRTIECQVGRDLKAHLVQPFLTKAHPRQDGPAPCPAEP